MRHVVKCDKRYWPALQDGRKTFEVRFNDRDYQAGDELELIEFEIGRAPAIRNNAAKQLGIATPKESDARHLLFVITYVLHSFEGLTPGYVGLGIKGCSPAFVGLDPP